MCKQLPPSPRVCHFPTLTDPRTFLSFPFGFFLRYDFHSLLSPMFLSVSAKREHREWVESHLTFPFGGTSLKRKKTAFVAWPKAEKQVTPLLPARFLAESLLATNQRTAERCLTSLPPIKSRDNSKNERGGSSNLQLRIGDRDWCSAVGDSARREFLSFFHVSSHPLFMKKGCPDFRMCR